MKKKLIVNFNHISKSLSNEDKEKFINLYKTHHKLAKCYKIKYNTKKYRLLFMRVISKVLVTVGAAVGGITLNPVVLGSISGLGMVIISYFDKSNLHKDIEKCKLAYTSYEKVLTELRNYLRGVHYDETKFLSNITLLDDMITDNCPSIDNVAGKYNRKY